MDALLNDKPELVPAIEKRLFDIEKRILLMLKAPQMTGENSKDFQLVKSFQGAINAVEEHVSRDVNKINAFEFLSKMQMLEQRAKAMKQRSTQPH